MPFLPSRREPCPRDELAVEDRQGGVTLDELAVEDRQGGITFG